MLEAGSTFAQLDSTITTQSATAYEHAGLTLLDWDSYTNQQEANLRLLPISLPFT